MLTNEKKVTYSKTLRRPLGIYFIEDSSSWKSNWSHLQLHLNISHLQIIFIYHLIRKQSNIAHALHPPLSFHV